MLFDDGAATREAQLRAADVTSDGRRVWLVGTSGGVACYDVEQRREFDYSSPEETTSTWETIAVTGEKVLAANGSGEVLPFVVVGGFDVNWGRLRKPAKKGANVAALAATPDGVGFAIDTSGNAFRTSAEDGLQRIGALDSQRRLYDVWAGENQRVYVSAGDGCVYRYDDSVGDWAPIGVTDGVALRSIDVEIDDDDVGQMVVIGGDGSLYQRLGDEHWIRLPSPTNLSLLGRSVGGDLDVAVGNGGTVLERPQRARTAGTSPDGDQYDGRGENYDQPTDERRHSHGTDDDGTSESEGGDGSSDPGRGQTLTKATADRTTRDRRARNCSGCWPRESTSRSSRRRRSTTRGHRGNAGRHRHRVRRRRGGVPRRAVQRSVATDGPIRGPAP